MLKINGLSTVGIFETPSQIIKTYKHIAQLFNENLIRLRLLKALGVS